MNTILQYISTRSIPNIRYLIPILTLVSICSSYGQGNTALQEANTLYTQEQYKEAIVAYTSIIESGETSTALYYNLANAYYKTNAIAESIYYYEKALLLSPNDEDVQNNLAFANKATIDAIETLPEGIFSRFMNTITYRLSVDGWAWVSIIAILLFVVGYLSYYMTRTPSKKRLFFMSSLIALGIGITAVCFAFMQHTHIQNTQYAIVFSPRTSVKSEPNLRSEAVFELHEGTKVRLVEQLNDWKKIRLADGKLGWIPATDLKAL